MRDARLFQTNLTDYLKARHFPYFGATPRPHVTIYYRRDGLKDESIDPIEWAVNEVLLIESVVGQTRHVPHGSWLLRGAAA